MPFMNISWSLMRSVMVCDVVLCETVGSVSIHSNTSADWGFGDGCHNIYDREPPYKFTLVNVFFPVSTFVAPDALNKSIGFQLSNNFFHATFGKPRYFL